VVLYHNLSFASCWHRSFFDLERVALRLRDPGGFVGHDALSRGKLIMCVEGCGD
jgi:hypothetical protein